MQKIQRPGTLPKWLAVLVAFVVATMLQQVVAHGAVQEAPQEGETRLQVSDDQLQAVAKAYLEVVSIQEEYRPRIEAAQSAEEAQQLQQDAQGEMVAAIEDIDGVTVPEYNAIIGATETDGELAMRLSAHIQSEMEAQADDEAALRPGRSAARFA